MSRALLTAPFNIDAPTSPAFCANLQFFRTQANIIRSFMANLPWLDVKFGRRKRLPSWKLAPTLHVVLAAIMEFGQGHLSAAFELNSLH
jgi:hypothetical protein